MGLKRIILFIVLLVSYNLFGQFNDSVESIEKRLEKETDSVRKAHLYLKLSKLYGNNDFRLSEKYAQKSLEINNRNKNEIGAALAKLQLSDLFQYILPEYAYDLAMEAHQLFISTNDSASMIKSLKAIANVVSTQNDFKKALEIYTEALNLCVAMNDTSMMAPLLNNIAMCHAYNEDYLKAKDIFKKALKRNLPSNLRFESNILGNLGKAYEELEVYDSVLSFYQQSEKMKLSINDQKGLGWLYNIFSSYYQKIDMLDSAEIYARKALCYSKEVEMLEFEHYAYVNLRDIYLIKDHKDSVIHYYALDKILSDSISGKDKLRTTDLLTIKAELEKNMIIKELKNTQLKNQLITSGIVIVLTFVLILFLLVILALRKKKMELEKANIEIEKENIEKDLIMRNREITAHIMNAASKNNLLENLIKKLQVEQSSFKLENQKKIQDIINELKLNLNHDIWKEFELRFSDVQPQFYKNLLDRFPNLTPSELKLSAFLKLNMSTKEIAVITQQNVKSIEKARVRLRKKLDINNTDISLNVFLTEY